MSWISDLGSSLGIPAGAATAALTMYAACSAAEKAAQPSALQAIGRILKDPSWSRSVEPSAILRDIFVWTFGARQFSWKCVRRSAMATIFFTIGGCFLFHDAVRDFIAKTGTAIASASSTTGSPVAANIGAALGGIFILLFTGLLPDFLALWKTRYLTGVLSTRKPSLLITPILDIVLSLTISYLCASFFWVLLIIAYSTSGITLDTTEHGVVTNIDVPGSFIDLMAHSLSLKNCYDILAFNYQSLVNVLMGRVSSVREITLLSTLFTSIWTVLMLLSTVVLKVVVPMERFTVWFFNVDEHPVQAIGIVSGALVMLGAGVWSVVRSLV